MKLLACVFLLLCAAPEIRAQADILPAPVPDLPQLFVDALSFSSDQPGKSRLDIYMEIPYENLRFLKEGDVFRAKFELTISVEDSNEKVIDEKWWKESAETNRYDESVSPRAGKLIQKSFLLTPGQYQVVVTVKDSETGKTARVQHKVTVKDFQSAAFSVSDIMIANSLDTSGGRATLYPNITGNVGELKNGCYVFFEIYNSIGADSAEVALSIRDFRETSAIGDTFREPITPIRQSTIRLERTNLLPAGDYQLSLRVIPLSKAPDPRLHGIVATAEHQVFVRWRGMPVSIVDLDKAIDQLQYIATKDEIDEMKDAPADKKKGLFFGFWKKRDPTPGTERNELMDEYYARVAYANKHFGHYLEGWKTDMGMVYIIFGVPNNIERHPFDIDSKPYEIWTYYDQNREFVFIDATGFGDYRLQNPIWDLYRTRPR